MPADSPDPDTPPAQPEAKADAKPDSASAESEQASDSSPAGFLYQAFDDMISVLGLGDHADEVAQARTRYEDRRGRVFEDEELWDGWSQAFLEWYALEPEGTAEPPAAAYLDDIRANSPDQDRHAAAIAAWMTSHRSLFEVRALRAGRVELLDVLGGGWFAVAEQRFMAGVSVGDVAELRLIGFDGDVRFGRTFLFHPSGTRDAILMQAHRIRQSGGTRRDVVDFCASLRIRCIRYRHVSPRRVYESATPTLPVKNSDAALVEPASSDSLPPVHSDGAGDPGESA